jgi:predicted DNA-binding WGR domain protein
MLSYEWGTDTRYYRLELMQDLFGVWIITRRWRGRYSNCGNSKIISVSDQEQIQPWIHRIHKERSKRGYRLLTTPPTLS